MPHLTEEDIKNLYITPALDRCWDKELFEYRMEVKITDGRINNEGNINTRQRPLYADYILYLNEDNPIAVVEAKDQSHSASFGLQQAMNYALMLDVPFAYASNGLEFVEHDFLTGKVRSIPMDQFPTREELIKRYKEGANEGKGINLDEEKVMKWLQNGAQPSDTVRSILSKQGLMKKFHESKLAK